ncbi:hypothetical protein AX768_13415 [Burkholderia sp. PAMC 28687]|uniref:hypothetical protein n=1 Tax=Burkholderia sp. PAMC 28687 TaxID=1795874 RepID=UPI0007814BC2|nr:hypothetical protein [Burkholderia sp. PAMC 28687]AMM14948.1 hypothetical protein AX768_13415 [Burkholderia sp. PAMC 28687]
MTPERVAAMYNPDYTDAPKAAPGDDNARAVKSASGEAQDMTIYAENDPALAAHAETRRVLKKIASQKIDPQIIQIDDDGKDKPMPPILQRPPGMGQFPAAQNINVKVTAPAGSSVAVTSSNFPG